MSLDDDLPLNAWLHAERGNVIGLAKCIEDFPKVVDWENSDAHFTTCLWIAAKSGHVNCCRLLAENGANLEAKDSYQESTPLHEAARHGRFDVLAYLLSKGSVVDEKIKDGSTALMLAGKNGHELCFGLLLGHGASVNAKNEQGDSVLACAASHGQLAVCQTLVEHGALINTQRPDRTTPLYHAASAGFAQVCAFLLENGASAVVNVAETENNDTPLHAAATIGCTAACKVLLAHGANINAVSNDNLTPLHFSVCNKKKECCDLLLAAGANVNTQSCEREESVLHIAASNGWAVIIPELVNHGARVHARMLTGDTALHAALIYHRKECCFKLVDVGADVNAQNHSGASPMHLAATLKSLSLVKYLCIVGQPDLLLRNREGKTPADCTKENEKLFRFLTVEYPMMRAGWTVAWLIIQSRNQLNPLLPEMCEQVLRMLLD